MTIFDLVLILAVLGFVLAAILLCYFTWRRRWGRVRRILLVTGCFFAIYALMLLTASILSPQHVLDMHQDRCFDDWCLSVENVMQQPTIGDSTRIVTAHGIYYLVTLRVSSRARGISQRALDVQVYLLDGNNRRYTPDPAGQQILDESGRSGSPLDSRLAPGGSFNRVVAFDVPESAPNPALLVTHGVFPEALIIGSEQSLFHKPTIIQLQIQ